MGSKRINATVTPCEGDQPGPSDWAQYVAERLSEDYPGFEISVEYGPSQRAFVYGHDGAHDLEDQHEFRRIVQSYWIDLCNNPDHEQWSADRSDIQSELDRLGASSTADVSGLDCDDVTDGVATFSDSQVVARYDAEEALAALRGATRDGEESGFDAAWHALARLECHT